MPPAASVGPSLPSVPPLRITTLSGKSDILMAAARQNSWFLPPFPFPLMVTVVSPPDIMQHGGATGLPVLIISSAIAV